MGEEVINYKRMAKDIAKNGYDVVFLNEFPEASEAIQNVKNKSGCGSCLVTNMPKIFEHPKFDEKIRTIYGDALIDLSMPKKGSGEPIAPPRNRATATVEEYTEEEWKEFWNNNADHMLTERYHLVSTYYKPETKTVVVSILKYNNNNNRG